MMKLNDKERKILAMAHYSQIGIFPDDCIKFYKTPHHIKNVLKFLVENRLLAVTESNRFIITDEGRAAVGIESRQYKKLTEFTMELDENGHH